jgi:hypothetical protein
LQLEPKFEEVFQNFKNSKIFKIANTPCCHRIFRISDFADYTCATATLSPIEFKLGRKGGCLGFIVYLFSDSN